MLFHNCISKEFKDRYNYYNTIGSRRIIRRDIPVIETRLLKKKAHHIIELINKIKPSCSVKRCYNNKRLYNKYEESNIKSLRENSKNKN